MTAYLCTAPSTHRCWELLVESTACSPPANSEYGVQDGHSAFRFSLPSLQARLANTVRQPVPGVSNYAGSALPPLVLRTDAHSSVVATGFFEAYFRALIWRKRLKRCEGAGSPCRGKQALRHHGRPRGGRPRLITRDGVAGSIRSPPRLLLLPTGSKTPADPALSGSCLGLACSYAK